MSTCIVNLIKVDSFYKENQFVTILIIHLSWIDSNKYALRFYEYFYVVTI
jgi:hypothetical protein